MNHQVVGIQPESLSELGIEAIDGISVDELEAVNSHALQEQCMSSSEMPWLQHIAGELKKMVTDYFDQFFKGYMLDWIEDSVIRGTKKTRAP